MLFHRLALCIIINNGAEGIEEVASAGEKVQLLFRLGTLSMGKKYLYLYRTSLHFKTLVCNLGRVSIIYRALYIALYFYPSLASRKEHEQNFLCGKKFYDIKSIMIKKYYDSDCDTEK